MKKSSNKGFTLVELIIVIAILAIIMLIAIPNFSGIQQRMQVRADKSTAAQIGKAVRVWMTDYTTDDMLNGPRASATSYTPDYTSNLYYPIDITSISAFDANDLATVVPVIYTGLKGFVPEYISGDSEPSSLLDGTGKVEPNQYYAVALTSNAANPEAKIVVMIVPSTSAKTAPSTLTIYNADNKLIAGYDGTTNNNADNTKRGNPIAYIEP